MRIELHHLSLGALRPDPHNPRQMPEAEMQALMASLSEFGFVDPVLVRKGDRMVIGGHQRLEAAKRLGMTDVPVVELDLTDEQARALNVALNRISGEWDVPKLHELLEALPDDLAALTGFDEKQMRKIAAEADAAIRAMREQQDGLDEIPDVPDEPITKRGDLWLLGEHRILCGDSTNEDDVARLMNGEKTSLFASDPPYLVDYQGGNHPQSWHNRAEVKDKHWDDYSDPKIGAAFFESFLRLGLAHCKDNIAVYQWFATKRHDLVEAAWRAVGLLAHQELVWVKARSVLTRCDFMWQHEPCMYGWVEGNRPSLKPPANESTVWSINQQGQQDGIHPTQKPVELFLRPIRWHTLPGEVCYEPFSGSGTQIIAAEQLERRCFAMELSPAFVDVAVARFEKVTGKKAERIQTPEAA